MNIYIFPPVKKIKAFTNIETVSRNDGDQIMIILIWPIYSLRFFFCPFVHKKETYLEINK